MFPLAIFRFRGFSTSTLSFRLFPLAVLVAFFFAGVPEAHSQRAVRVSIGGTERLESEGVALRVFRNLKAVPPQFPQAHNFTMTQGDQRQTVVCLDVVEIWRYDQIIGRWGGSPGTITAAMAKLPAPDDGLARMSGHERFTLRDDYEAWKEGKTPPSADDISQWLEFFTGEKLVGTGTTETVRSGTSRFEVVSYNLQDGNAQIRVVRPVNTNDERVLVLMYELSPSADAGSGARAIDSSVKSLQFQPPKEAEVRQRTARRQGTRDDWTPEYLDSREKAINNIRNVPGWWYLETDNFVMVSNEKSRRSIETASTALEDCRLACELLYPLGAPLKEVSVARVFAGRDEFVGYIGQEGASMGGYWSSSHNELVMSPQTWGSSSQKRDWLREVVYHEAFHQYIFYATGKGQTAVWFNEGNATFFEGLSVSRGGKITFDISDRWAREFKKAGQSLTISRLRSLLAMDYQTFYNLGNRNANYSQSWALIYFMMKGASVMDKPEYHEIPFKYYEAHRATGNPRKATETAWQSVDMEAFVNDFNTFWSTNRLVGQSTRFDLAATRFDLAAAREKQ